MSNSNVALAAELMPDNVMTAVDALEAMPIARLRERYREVVREDARSNNGPWLRKRIGYRLQEIAYGGLSDRAKARLQELLVDAPIRRRGHPIGVAAPPRPTLVTSPPAPPVAPTPPPARPRDPRLPPPGTPLQRTHARAVHTVVVEEDGFTFRGERHDSLSKIAKLITGTSWSGFAFFGLTKPWEAQ